MKKYVYQSAALREKSLKHDPGATPQKRHDPRYATFVVRDSAGLRTYGPAHSVHIQGPSVFKTPQVAHYPPNWGVVEVAAGIPVQLLDADDQIIEEIV